MTDDNTTPGTFKYEVDSSESMHLFHHQPIRSHCYIGGKQGMCCHLTSPMPNRFHRWWQRYLLGFIWEAPEGE